VILAGFTLGFLIIYRAINSPFGEVLKAIRENEPRAVSLGYKTDQYKLLAYILSGTLAGFAGALKVFVAQNASLTDVHWSMSGEIVLITLVGGLGTLFGPVVGAFVIIAMQQYLAGFGQWVTVIQGVIFVVCVLTFRADRIRDHDDAAAMLEQGQYGLPDADMRLAAADHQVAIAGHGLQEGRLAAGVEAHLGYGRRHLRQSRHRRAKAARILLGQDRGHAEQARRVSESPGIEQHLFAIVDRRHQLRLEIDDDQHGILGGEQRHDRLSSSRRRRSFIAPEGAAPSTGVESLRPNLA
jgi:hypothetical protein